MYDDVTWYYLDKFLKHLPKDSQILDLGCGTGYVSIGLLERGFKNITAMDISEGMLDIFKENLRKINESSALDVNIVAGDFHYLNKVLNTKFDAIICQGSALSCTQDFENVFSSIVTILNPGGWVNISVHSRIGSISKIVNGGNINDLPEALNSGLWYWYEKGQQVHKMHLFAEEDFCHMVEKTKTKIVHICGKLVIPRETISQIKSNERSYKSALKFCKDYGENKRLIWLSEYIQATFVRGD
jgi:ubiquinone/menaquinone biosynthesis C-methylase UbiE